MKQIQTRLENKKGDEFLSTLHDIAVEEGISDLHFFPKKENVELGWRQDGIMQSVFTMTHELYTDVVRRIKFASKLSLNITNVPQDGEYAFAHNIKDSDEKREVKVRVSSLPSKFGEVFTLRLLDPKKGIVPLEKLGFQADIEKEMRDLVQKPHGIMLVTGPTGSGKTTTLYSLLSTLVGTGKNIITLEDPVEYPLEGIVQSQIDHKHDYTFAKGLRAILRQDPDVILVGEIRDAETAKTAADAALTGHMVFATLHTNSAIESIPRLLSMGVDSYMLAPALRGILAQRLIRRVCKDCDGKKENNSCDTCIGTGYKGRMTLPELLMIDDGMRNLILEGALQKELEEYAKKHGFKTMKERGEEVANQGDTDMAEVSRVTS
ncbi:type II/IV secretion system protein [Candidatus Peribacteria bacterium]|jgi:general secretion pathway protein E|nr:type II/IV secretion system protein [Candidatus Peribacteria bacterium]MBT4020764.1 type II/IV secretion system protein [Candidatus Peribacteria bacterium]MBT4241044.1 type II/IV secretion system protein [Candidatus Peribacteria bacterium]MBT4474457.1 type II/IV secretion system protein [Candidatus Peribacteria bacterium]